MAPNSTLKVDVPTLLRGMEQINKEKREINSMLSILRPILEEMLQRHTQKHRLAVTYLDPVLKVKDPEGNSIALFAVPQQKDKARFELRICCSNETRASMLAISDAARAEHMSKGHVGIWHKFLQNLIDEILRRSDTHEEFGVFIEAAKRAK